MASKHPYKHTFNVVGDPAPESAMQARETADEYIGREYGDAIKAANVARILEGILVEIVKWRMGK